MKPDEILATVRQRGFVVNGDVTAEGRAWFKSTLGIDLPSGPDLLGIGLRSLAEEVLAGRRSSDLAPRTRAHMEEILDRP